MVQHANHPANAPTRPGSTATFRPFAIAVAGLTSLLLAVGAVAACSKATPADAPLGPVSSTVTTFSTSSGAADCSSSATCPDGRDKTGKKSSERGF